MADLQQWKVHYEVRSGMDNYRAVITLDSCTVTATEDTAEEIAREYIYDNDHHADPRIDPRVVILDIEMITEMNE